MHFFELTTLSAATTRFVSTNRLPSARFVSANRLPSARFVSANMLPSARLVLANTVPRYTARLIELNATILLEEDNLRTRQGSPIDRRP